MVDNIVISTQLDELCQRLCSILNQSELLDLVESIEEVVNNRNGYGQVVVDMARRRVSLISTVSQRKPGAIRK